MEPTSETLTTTTATVKCMRCGDALPVSPEVGSLVASLNAELAKAGEAPITETSTATCAACRAYLVEAKRKREQPSLELDREYFKRWRAGEIQLEDVPADVRARHWHHFQSAQEARGGAIAAPEAPRSGAATFAAHSANERPCSACERGLEKDDPIHGLYASCELARKPGEDDEP
jgi:hypothetical protein